MELNSGSYTAVMLTASSSSRPREATGVYRHEEMTHLLFGDSPGREVAHTVIEAVLRHMVVGGQEVFELEDSVWDCKKTEMQPL